MTPRLKELYYSKIQNELAKKLSLANKLMGLKWVSILTTALI